MIVLRKIIPFLFVGSFSVSATELQQFLFYPQNPSLVPIGGNLTIDDKGESSIALDINPFYPGITVASYCTAEKMDIPIKGNVRWWLLAPKGIVRDASGLRYEILNSSWELPSSNVDKVPGYETYVSPNIITEWNDPTQTQHFCWKVGSVQGAAGGYQQWKAKIRVERATAIPGNYSLNVPVRLGWEENKGMGVIEGSGWLKFPSILYQQPPVNISVDLTITSKCHFNTSPINLSHGTMTGRNADGNQTSPYNLNVTCTPGTSLSVRLLGAQKVSGKTDNYTQCGTGGMCELTFDNGKYDETMTVDSSKTLSIKSTYRLNDIAKPVAESFEGGGVLQVLVN
ncbi:MULTISPECIES: spore coat protein U domain-containing protein [Enterobacteriaceae]|uniref:spore coat protein U domain-containing protein n=1 Tax=Enterobacteriaceae TaxID=543 RepID=UPI0016043945|nr:MULTISPECIES: spore coat protein U domain-containing protein [Enterobacteriaceae]EBK6837721.1 hypothetical protein [Salmonella enterica]ELV1426139.1 spore coat protein U domain-containing protein [Escherichia coli]MBB8564879.1 spore coat protein U domain-containing protein [Escherichia coli]MCE9976079.1 spore coat U domain-containing protein [Escherichia coli]MCE9988626.1 spore coat U domain-containing protein [Escherichia coli]